MVRRHNQEDYEPDIFEKRSNDENVQYCEWCGRRLYRAYIEDNSYGTDKRTQILECRHCN